MECACRRGQRSHILLHIASHFDRTGGNCSTYADVALNDRILTATPPVRGELPTDGSTRTLYVATTGSDTSGTGTPSAPFASLHAAAAAIRKVSSQAIHRLLLVTSRVFLTNCLLITGTLLLHCHHCARAGRQVPTPVNTMRLQLSRKNGSIFSSMLGLFFTITANA